jgi:hypothetical protein
MAGRARAGGAAVIPPWTPEQYLADCEKAITAAYGVPPPAVVTVRAGGTWRAPVTYHYPADDVYRPPVTTLLPAVSVPGARPEEILAGIRAALAEPLGLPGWELPAYEIARTGCCQDCRQPPLYRDEDRCLYCHTLHLRRTAELSRAGHRASPARAPRSLAVQGLRALAAVILFLLVLHLLFTAAGL